MFYIKIFEKLAYRGLIKGRSLQNLPTVRFSSFLP